MIRVFVLTIVLLAASPRPADALLCHAILGCTCSVSAPTLPFGTVQPLSGGGTSAVGDVTVNCSNVIDALPSVNAKIGQGSYGTFADRKMRSAAGDLLRYNIYASTSYATILGDGTGGFPTLTVSGGVLSVGSWSATAHVYGYIPSTPTAKPGSYSDSVTVRIDW